MSSVLSMMIFFVLAKVQKIFGSRTFHKTSKGNGQLFYISSSEFAIRKLLVSIAVCETLLASVFAAVLLTYL